MAPEANPFGENNLLIDKLREEIPALNYPGSTFRVENEDCPDGSIKIMGMQSIEGPDTSYLNCDEVNMAIAIAEQLAGAGPA